MKTSKPTAFGANADGTPLLFGRAIRLRNLLALAKYGPMYTRDLVKITGSRKTHETAANAPFGRGGVVRTWKAESGYALDLDPAHPVARPLRLLLIAIEKQFPVHCYKLSLLPPVPPPLQPWQGDRLALFGSPIPTHILFTIGALGWTFEGLCVSAASGYDRVPVKKALKRLEDEGILAGERDRRPGFNVRKVTISDNCAGNLELRALLVACVEVWPDLKRSVQLAMDQLSPRTKEHLRRRGLLEHTPRPKRKAMRRDPLPEIPLNADPKERALLLYRRASIDLGKIPTSADLRPKHRTVYLKIITAWGGFSTFCEMNGIFPEYRRKKRIAGLAINEKLEALRTTTNVQEVTSLDIKRKECLLRYQALMQKHGCEITSSELQQVLDSNLYRSIRACWGTFAEFRAAAKLTPKQTGVPAGPNPALRERCIAEYSALSKELGRSPNSAEIKNMTGSLIDRIAQQWGTFGEFCEEMRIPLSRRHRDLKISLPVLRKRCRNEYLAAMKRVGYAPSSRQLQDITDGLYRRIKRAWGSFEEFCDDLGVEPARMRRKKASASNNA